MADPIIPNYNSGAGRLATDRFTYQEHITGLDDRHKANQIDLFPTVVIGSEQTTVQDAIAAISLVIGTPPPDASTSVKGIVRLTGDISGTATNVVVTRLQGKPVSSLTPSSGDVLTWDGSTWKPQSITGSFTNLTVTGNTTLGTNSSNTLVVNAQTTLSNNLTVNGNTVLGNANSDSTTVQGSLSVSGGNISITGATSATFAANSALTLSGASTATLTAGTSLSLVSGTIGITSSGNLTATASGTLSLNGNAVTIPNTVSTFVIQPSLYTSLQGNVQQNSGTFSIFTGASFNIFPAVTCSVQSTLIMSGAAKINKKYTDGPNSSTSIYPALYDVYRATSSIITNNRTWSINETLYTATLQGLEVEITNTSIYTITVNDPGGFSIATVGSFQAAVFYRNSTTWALKYRFNMV